MRCARESTFRAPISSLKRAPNLIWRARPTVCCFCAIWPATPPLSRSRWARRFPMTKIFVVGRAGAFRAATSPALFCCRIRASFFSASFPCSSGPMEPAFAAKAGTATITRSSTIYRCTIGSKRLRPPLYASAREIFEHEVAPQLANARLPADRNHALTFNNGARADLRAVLRAAFALENLDKTGILRATAQSENPFDRAGFWAARGEGGEAEVWFDRESGQRFRLPWKADGLRLSRRFGCCATWPSTPRRRPEFTGIIITKGAGGFRKRRTRAISRCNSSPTNCRRTPKRAPWLAAWLLQIGADAEILDWNEVEVSRNANGKFKETV